MTSPKAEGIGLTGMKQKYPVLKLDGVLLSKRFTYERSITDFGFAFGLGVPCVEKDAGGNNTICEEKENNSA